MRFSTKGGKKDSPRRNVDSDYDDGTWTTESYDYDNYSTYGIKYDRKYPSSQEQKYWTYDEDDDDEIFYHDEGDYRGSLVLEPSIEISQAESNLSHDVTIHDYTGLPPPSKKLNQAKVFAPTIDREERKQLNRREKGWRMEDVDDDQEGSKTRQLSDEKQTSTTRTTRIDERDDDEEETDSDDTDSNDNESFIGSIIQRMRQGLVGSSSTGDSDDDSSSNSQPSNADGEGSKKNKIESLTNEVEELKKALASIKEEAVVGTAVATGAGAAMLANRNVDSKQKGSSSKKPSIFSGKGLLKKGKQDKKISSKDDSRSLSSDKMKDSSRGRRNSGAPIKEVQLSQNEYYEPSNNSERYRRGGQQDSGFDPEYYSKAESGRRSRTSSNRISTSTGASSKENQRRVGTVVCASDIRKKGKDKNYGRKR